MTARTSNPVRATNWCQAVPATISARCVENPTGFETNALASASSIFFLRRPDFARMKLKRHTVTASNSTPIASHSKRLSSSVPSIGTTCVLRSNTVQYCMTSLIAAMAVGSISAAAVR